MSSKLVYLIPAVLLGSAVGFLATFEKALLWGAPLIGLLWLAVISARLRWTHCLVPLVIIFAVCAERFVLRVPSAGGRGVIPVLYLIIGIVAVLMIAHSRRILLQLLCTPQFSKFVAPYLVLTFLLPLLAPFLMGYPARTSAASVGAVTAFTFLIMGFRCSQQDAKNGTSSNTLLAPYLTFGVILQSVYALGQFLYNSGILSSITWGPLHAWDRALADAYGIPWISGRSTGLYLNPNVLGLFGAIALLYAAWTPLPRRRRFLIGVPALLTTVLSHSRGALLALFVALFAQMLRAFKRPWRMLTQLVALITVLASIGVGIWALSRVGGSVGEQLVERLQAGLAIFTKGISADPNLVGRTLLWRKAIDSYLHHPLGTLGPPEYIVGSSIDSEWIRLLVQGGPLYLLSFILLLLWSLSGDPIKDPEVAFIQALAVLIAVAGLTQHPMSYVPTISIYWFFVGMRLQRRRGCPKDRGICGSDLRLRISQEGHDWKGHEKGNAQRSTHFG